MTQLPSPEMHADWRSFARALLAAIGDGLEGSGGSASSVDAGGITGTISPAQLPPLPAGFTPVWLNNSDANLYLGNPDYDPPQAANIVYIDTANIALAAIATANLQDGLIIESKLGPGSVTTVKIGNAAIGTAQIANAAIVTALIGDAQIVSAKILDLAVNEAKIANLSVSSGKIANLAVGVGKIAALAVGTAEIQNAAVGNAQIGNLAVGTANIQLAAITNALIGNAAINTANIGSAQITQALIAALAVGAAQIQDLAVGSAKIADLAVTSAKIASLTFDKMTAGTLNAVIDMGTGLIRFTIGGNKLVLGKGFGTANQFVMWFGPDVAENLMSESSAIFFLKVNGDAYFGGSLRAGVLKNSVQTSNTADNAVIETGTFGSNGNTIEVVCSYSYSVESPTSYYEATLAGRNDFDAAAAAAEATDPDGSGSYFGSKAVAATITVTLARSVGGGAFANVATINITGGTQQFTGFRPVIGDSSGSANYHYFYGGSITYTDPQLIASDRNYRATLTQRTGVSTLGTVEQRIGITATED